MRRFVPLLIVLLAAVLGAVRYAAKDGVPGDFLRYHRAGRLVATGRADLLYDEAYLDAQKVYADERVPGGDDFREMEFKYAPALAVMMAPLGALPPRAASIAWGALNEALLAAMFVALWSWCGRGLSAWWALAPVVVLWRPLDGNFRLGQLNPSAIVPATLGVWLLHRGKDRAAGALVGLAAVVKFMPGLLALWFAVKRRWAALAALLATVVVLGVALPAAALGPSRSAALTKEWIEHRAHHYTESASQDLPGYSVKSFVYRALGDVPFVTFDEGEKARIVIGSGTLAPDALRRTYVAVDVALVLLALWLARGPLRGPDDPRGAQEAALMFVVLPLVSPEARFPHFAYLALPVTALVASFARDGVATARRSVAAAFGLVGALAFYATSSKFLGEAGGLYAEACCAPGWGALAIGISLVLVMRDGARSDAGK